MYKLACINSALKSGKFLIFGVIGGIGKGESMKPNISKIGRVEIEEKHE